MKKKVYRRDMEQEAKRKRTRRAKEKKKKKNRPEIRKNESVFSLHVADVVLAVHDRTDLIDGKVHHFLIWFPEKLIIKNKVRKNCFFFFFSIGTNFSQICNFSQHT